MFAFVYSFLLALAAAGDSAAGGFAGFWNSYFNVPGFELWRLLNLAIFVGILIYLLKKPLSEQFKAKREAIRADLIRAEEEKQAALAELTAAEAKLASLDAEKRAVIERARAEAEEERLRIVSEAESEEARLQEQAAGEVVRLGKQVRVELRRFAAEESIRKAEEKLRQQVNVETDGRLVKAGIEAIGGLR